MRQDRKKRNMGENTLLLLLTIILLICLYTVVLQEKHRRIYLFQRYTGSECNPQNRVQSVFEERF